ncbi:hypothetical protein GRF59_27695 [Paenibacillus sp. HJL G12]|uniref:Phage tail collar domain-containing protein n=1 Tax=Paenibacillus dendrobii TaxID=2691084 RepID=A0A7X3IR52_9BACL|nr:phage tail protein [Paenibacillus dendrobii]MWV47385.1 hypothetical protein [Paenibacillus dendrobii]
MNKPYLGEIRKFTGESAPAGWVFCNGQELSVEQYQSLYAVIGAAYGGDGVNTFKVPELPQVKCFRTRENTAVQQQFMIATEGLVHEWNELRLT